MGHPRIEIYTKKKNEFGVIRKVKYLNSNINRQEAEAIRDELLSEWRIKLSNKSIFATSADTKVYAEICGM